MTEILKAADIMEAIQIGYLLIVESASRLRTGGEASLYLLSFLLTLSIAMAGGLPKPGDPDDPNPPTPGSNFDFKQEGMYKVQVTCTPRPQDCNAAMMQQLNRISVIDS